MDILLVDDHTLFREGLGLLMQARFSHVRLHQACSLADAAEVLARLPRPDCVLLDLGLPDSQGIETLHRFCALAPQARVVVMSAETAPALILAVMTAGADGFIPKTARRGQIEADLRAVLAGQLVLPETALPVAERTLPALQLQPDRIEALGLSGRQLDVLRLLAEGLSNKQIGRELDLAESTVKSHLLVIFRKLGVSSRTGAMLQAQRCGLLDLLVL
ncbi:MAG: hypothetical protein RJA44_723 [Pseudomonadota bacterium]|jgi:DNA-binding NarL/FixJ family response regulator